MPWRLLFKRFGLMFVAMLLLVSLTSRDQAGGLATGLVFGGILFFALSWLMSKFGFAPKTMKQIRAEAEARAAASDRPVRQSRRDRKAGITRTATPPARPKPPPTKRTASGVGRHPQPRKR